MLVRSTKVIDHSVPHGAIAFIAAISLPLDMLCFAAGVVSCLKWSSSMAVKCMVNVLTMVTTI